VPHEPALCLVCGQLLCCAGACCAQAGGPRECFAHAQACGAGVGVFLLVRATRLVLLRGGRRCVYPSPYLDEYGEEDAYLRRGRPLHLCAPRYALVQRLWAHAAFDSDSHTVQTSRLGAAHF
jgi:E3 ubiquitin-protein ligase UBR3